MRLLLLTALLALLASLVLANDTIDCRSSNRNGEQNREIVQAINAFCGWTWDLVSPVFSLHSKSHFTLPSCPPIPTPTLLSFFSLADNLTPDRPQRQSQVRCLQQKRQGARQHQRRDVRQDLVGAAQVLHFAVLPGLRGLRQGRQGRQRAVGLRAGQVPEVHHFECVRYVGRRKGGGYFSLGGWFWFRSSSGLKMLRVLRCV